MERIDYARQYLDEKGIKIFAGKEQILKYENDFSYPKKELKTSITFNQDFLIIKNKLHRKNYCVPITSYKKLKEQFNYGVISETLKTGDDKIKKVWRLVKIERGINILLTVKDVDFWYYPFIRAIKGEGAKFIDEEKQEEGLIKEGSTGLIYLDKKEEEEEEMTTDKFWREKMGITETDKKEEKKIEIPETEIVVMITEDNYLLVLEKKKDMQRILFVSMIGKGKTYGTISLAGRIFYRFKDKVGIIAPIGIFRKISLPSQDFIEDLKKIGEDTLPIPAVHLKMSCPNLVLENNITFRLVNSFFDFLSRYDFFSYGINKYKLDKPMRYLNSLKHKIKHCKNADCIKRIMYEHFPKDKGDKYGQMIFKWRDTFEGIFNEQFTSNLFENDYPEWEVKRDGLNFKTNPFIASVYSDLFTILNITDAKSYPTFRNRFADLIQQFINFQKKYKKRTWIIPDEMNEFYEHKKGRVADKCSEMVIELFRQGRNLNTGIIGNTQSYDGLDLDVRKNTNILFCGTINTDSERRLIAKDYKLDNKERDRLAELKTFEFMVMSKEPFVFYDKEWNRYEEKRTFVGKLIPPISTYLPPEEK